jgi:Rap guanine nucleotide exchange factor 1
MAPTIREIVNDSAVPPALPPKRSRSVKASATPPPVSPKPTAAGTQSPYLGSLDPIVTSTPVKAEEPVAHSPLALDKKEVLNANNVTLVRHTRIIALLLFLGTNLIAAGSNRAPFSISYSLPSQS